MGRRATYRRFLAWNSTTRCVDPIGYDERYSEDQAMSTTDSVTRDALVANAMAITEREMRVYGERTRASQVATARARKVMPAGVPSSFQAYEPHPIVVK